MKKKLIYSIILIALILQCNLKNLHNSIRKDKEFPIISTYTNDAADQNLIFCFSEVIGINYLVVKSSSLTQNSLITNTDNLDPVNYIYDLNNFIATRSSVSYTYSEDEEAFFLESDLIPKMKYNNTYCLSIKAYQLKKTSYVGLYGVSSKNKNKIIYYSEKYYSSLDLYSLDQASLRINSSSTTPSDIYFNTKFDLNINFKTYISENRVIPMTNNAIIEIVFSSEVINLSSVFTIISSYKINNDDSLNKNLLGLDSSNIEILKNKIRINKLSEDLVASRQFGIKITNLTLLKLSNIDITVNVLWKNTNSIISTMTQNNIIKPKYYELSNLTLKHVNNFPILYSKSSWPVILKFKVNDKLLKSSIKIKSNDSNVLFINSTCDFTNNSDYNKTYCYCNSTYTEMNLTYANIHNNSYYTILFWINIDSGFDLSTTNTQKLFTIIINGYTKETIIIPNFNIEKNFKSTFPYLEHSDPINGSPKACEGKITDTNDCVKLLSEHSGNFILSRTSSLTSYNSNKDSTKFMSMSDLSDLKILNYYFSSTTDFNLKTNNFRLRTRLTSTGNSNPQIKNYIAINTNYKNEVLYGEYDFYFPMNWLTRNTNKCDISWRSGNKEYDSISSTRLLQTRADITNHSSLVLGYSSTDDAYINNYQSISAISSKSSSSDLMKLSIINHDNNKIYNNIKLTSGFLLELSNIYNCLEKDLTITNSLNKEETVTSYSNCSLVGKSKIPTSNYYFDFDISTNCFKYTDEIEDSEQIKNSLVQGDTYNISLYSSFDFMITFSDKLNKKIIRSNRWVSLLPQPGIFSKIRESSIEYPSNPENMIYKKYAYLSSVDPTFDAVCLLSFDFRQSNLVKIRKNNLLVLFLSGIEVLSYEDMNSYPISYNNIAYQTTIVRKNIKELKYFDNNLQEPTNLSINCSCDSNCFKISTYSTLEDVFSSSSYLNYFGDLLKINNSLISTINNIEEHNFLETYIPIKCNIGISGYSELNNSSYSLSRVVKSNFILSNELNYSDSSNTNYKAVNYYSNSNDHLNSGILRSLIFSSQAKSNVFISGSNDKFSYSKTSKNTLIFNKEEESTSNLSNLDNRKYIFLASKYPIISSENVGDLINNEVYSLNTNSGIINPDNYYISYSANNTLILNKVEFTYTILLTLKDSSTYFPGIRNDSFGYSVSFNKVPINYNLPLKDNDLAIYIGGQTDDTNLNNDNTNYLITNYNFNDVSNETKAFKISLPEKTVFDKSTLDISVEYITSTSNMKRGNGLKTLCANISFKKIIYSNIVEIFSLMFESYTIAASKGSSNIKCTNNVGTKQSIICENLNSGYQSGNTVILTFCNINSTADFITITKLRHLFNNDRNLVYEEHNFDPPVSTSVTNINEDSFYKAPSISISFEKNQESYSYATITINKDFEIYRNMELIIVGDISSLLIDQNFKLNCLPYFDTPYNDTIDVEKTNNLGYKNKSSVLNYIFDTCVVDVSRGVIAVTTKNDVIYFDSISETFNIKIWPVLPSKTISAISFYVYTFFNGPNIYSSELYNYEYLSKKTKIFPVETYFPEIDISNWISSPVDLSKYMKIVSFEPRISGITSKVIIQLDLSKVIINKDTINNSSSTSSNNTEINEIRVLFNHLYYGTISSNDVIDCIVNYSKIYNCYFDSILDSVIIKENNIVTLSQSNIIIEIYGLKTPYFESSYLSDSYYNEFANKDLEHNNINFSISLVSFNFVHKGNTPYKTLFQAYSKIKNENEFSNTEINSYFKNPQDTSSNGNLRLISHEISNVDQQTVKSKYINPNTNSNYIIKLTIDNLKGIYFSNPISTVTGYNLYIYLPKNIELTSISYISLIQVNEIYNSNSEDKIDYLEISYTINKITEEYVSRSSNTSSNSSSEAITNLDNTNYVNFSYNGYGNFIACNISTTQNIYDNFKYWKLTLHNIHVSSEEGRSGIPDIVFYNSSSNYYLRTFPLLYILTNKVDDTEEELEFNKIYINSDNIEINENNETTDYISLLKNINFHRGLNIKYNTDKFYFNVTMNTNSISDKNYNIYSLNYNEMIDIHTGVYETLHVSIKRKVTSGVVKNAFTLISLSNYSSETFNIYTNRYILDSQMLKEVDILFGLNCNTIPGIHILSLISINEVDYFSFPILFFNAISSKIDSKNNQILQLWRDENNKYNKDTIYLGKGGFINFFVKPLKPNVDSITLNFDGSYYKNYSTTIGNTNINPKTKNFVNIKFEANENISSTQKFKINILNNDCFIPSVSYIEFSPSKTLEEIPYDLVFSDHIYYENKDNNTSLKENEINIIFDNRFRNTMMPGYDSKIRNFPTYSTIFCSLYCSSYTEPSDDALNLNYLTSLRNYNTFISEDTDTSVLDYSNLSESLEQLYYSYQNEMYDNLNHFVSYNHTTLIDNSKDYIVMKFSNLLRSNNYNLKCLITPGYTNIADKLILSEVVDKMYLGFPYMNSTSTEFNASMIESHIKTPDTKTLSCVKIYVNTKSSSFKEESQNILQNTFFKLGYEQNGCIVVLDDNNTALNGYENAILECDSYIDVVKSFNTQILDLVNATTTERRLLQNDTKNDENNFYYQFCMFQSNICSNDIDLDFYKATLTSLLEVEDKRVLKQKFRNNQMILSGFQSQLSAENLANYISYEIIEANSSFNFTDFNLNITNLTLAYDITYNAFMLEFGLKSSSNKDVNCIWTLSSFEYISNLIINYQTQATNYDSTKEIDLSFSNPDNKKLLIENMIACKSASGLIACSNSKTKDGVVPPAEIKKEVDYKTVIQDKTYYLLVTCKENIKISTLYSNITQHTVIAELTTFNEVKNSVSNNTSDSDYTYCTSSTNANFPECCLSGKASDKDKSICQSKYFSYSYVFLISIFLLFLIN